MGSPYSVTKDGYESQFGTNVVGHFAFTKLLLPTLESTASKEAKGNVRVINVSSAAHKLAPSGGIVFNELHLLNYWWAEWRRYGQSKLGNILLTNEITRRYGPKGIYSISVHPGGVNTNLASGTNLVQNTLGPLKNWTNWLAGFFMLTPAQGAITQLYAGTSPDIVTKNLNGAYLVPYGEVTQPSSYGQNAELAEKLWDFLDKEVTQKGI